VQISLLHSCNARSGFDKGHQSPYWHPLQLRKNVTRFPQY